MGAIAQYENPHGLDGTDPGNLKKIMESDIKTSPKFTELTVSYNDHPDVPPGGPSCKNPPPGIAGFAYTEQNFDPVNKDRAIICICDTAFRFPSLDSVKKEPRPLGRRVLGVRTWAGMTVAG